MPFLSSFLIIKCSMTMIYQIQFGRILVIIMMKNQVLQKWYFIGIRRWNKRLLWEVSIWSLVQSCKTSTSASSFKCMRRKSVSMVKKNKTPFRASMGFNTLRSILTVKLANPNGIKVNPDKALLKSAKSATCEYTVIKDTRFPHHPFPHKKVKK